MWTVLFYAAVLVFAAAIAGAAVRTVFALPPRDAVPGSTALPPGGTPLAGLADGDAALYPGTSGIHALGRGRAAFAARVRLAEMAVRSIDAQYYMWHHDFSGSYLLKLLIDAADRGVRVRLLLDDNTTGGHDAVLAAIAAHPNVEVRLFNPFALRWPRSIGYITDFFRLNRRMHNKSFTADGAMTVVGGRNIGDEYFGAGEGVQFADLDILAAGPIAAAVAKQFDEYWACASALPATLILPPAPADTLARFLASVEAASAGDTGRAYLESLRQTPVWEMFERGKLELDWVAAQLIYDPPAKGQGGVRFRDLMAGGLVKILGQPGTGLDLISPYFVPGRRGARFFTRLARGGRKIRVLTNTLAATDVLPVHAGYARYRRRLLRRKVEIFELSGQRPEVQARRGHLFGSSSSSLHAKTFAIDRQRLFVGSFNFDPRSVMLNCEMGLLIDHAALAETLSAAFDNGFGTAAYRVSLGRTGRVVWTLSHGERSIRYTREPHTTFRQRLAVWLIARLPVEWML